MYPLELYPRTKSNTRRASWREGLLRFAVFVSEKLGAFLEDIVEIGDPDFVTSYGDPSIFAVGPCQAIILHSSTTQPPREVVGCSER